MQIETTEQAERAAEQLLAFLLGLDAGKPHHIGINQMLRIASDIRCFLGAEHETPEKQPAQGPKP